jgi:hypothetical protein
VPLLRSCSRTTKRFVAAGAPVQLNSGEVPSPERVIAAGNGAHAAFASGEQPGVFVHPGDVTVKMQAYPLPASA